MTYLVLARRMYPVNGGKGYTLAPFRYVGTVGGHYEGGLYVDRAATIQLARKNLNVNHMDYVKLLSDTKDHRDRWTTQRCQTSPAGVGLL